MAGSEKAAVSAATARYWVASSSFVGPDRKAEGGSCAGVPDKAGEAAGDGEVWANPVQIVPENRPKIKRGVESAIAPQVAQKLAFFQCNLMHWGGVELDPVGLCVLACGLHLGQPLSHSFVCLFEPSLIADLARQ